MFTTDFIEKYVSLFVCSKRGLEEKEEEAEEEEGEEEEEIILKKKTIGKNMCLRPIYTFILFVSLSHTRITKVKS